MFVRVPSRIEQLDVTHQTIKRALAHGLDQLGIIDAHNRIVRARRTAVATALEQVHFALHAIIDSHERIIIEDRPRRRVAVDAKVGLDILEELERIFAVAITLIDEGEDRRATQLTDVEQLACALFDALAVIEQHDRAVRRDERAIRIFGEVFVARRIQQVQLVAEVLELQHGARHRDTALLLELHPVRGGVARGATRLHRAGQVDRAAVEQQLFGQRRFASVRMRDDRKGATAKNLTSECRAGDGRIDWGGDCVGHARKIIDATPNQPSRASRLLGKSRLSRRLNARSARMRPSVWHRAQ